MKRLLQKLHRPLVWAVSYFILGIVGGTIWAEGLYSSFFVYSFILILSVGVLIFYTNKWIYISLVAFIALGSFRFLYHPVEVENQYFNKHIVLSGTVISKLENPYNEAFVLDSVSILNKEKNQPVKSKVKLICKQDEKFNLGDRIVIKGKVKDRSKVYNPSDLDYTLYLKSQGIVREVEVKQVLSVHSNQKFLYTLREQMNNRIERLFKGRDDGIVHTLIMGEDVYLDAETENMYQILGIAHLLAISGLHMGIIASLLAFVLGYMGCGYTLRNGLSIVGIWSYSVLAGMSVSIVRASIMFTIMLVVRMLWEEEDMPISLALAAFVVLLINPFQLYQVGFQLSFVAVVGILLYQTIYSYLKHEKEWKKDKLCYLKYILPSLSITVCLAPIMAYHFYEIPVLSIFLNLLVIPLFGIMIPLIFITIGISFIMPSISMLLVNSILSMLEGIKIVGTRLAQLDFATWIVGRPSMFVIIFYYGLCMLVILKLKKVSALKIGYALILGISFFIGLESFSHRGQMEITQLYVGQGDCTIITTPGRKVVMIDSGPEQARKKVENYLKYKGVNTIEVAIISHAHEDHIAGLIYLIESGYKVKQVIWGPSIEENPYKVQLEQLCSEKNIPLNTLYAGDKVALGQVTLEVLSPYKQATYGDANEDSLVCLLKYNAFEALFTGDIGSIVEERLIEDLTDIDVLKVAHHGSKYSTSIKFLEKVRAEYGMISAGVHNRYGHPHPLTLERLKEQNLEIKCTDKQGAIFIRTDGKQYTVQSQIQEE